jgi:hypothetical protein
MADHHPKWNIPFYLGFALFLYLVVSCSPGRPSPEPGPIYPATQQAIQFDVLGVDLYAIACLSR